MNHPAADKSDLCDQLEALLGEMLAAHEDLLQLTQDHRAALSRADGAAVQACSLRHAAIADRIGQLEFLRRQLIAALSPSLPSASITSLAADLPEPSRGRIMEAAGRLKALLLRIQQELRVLRAATQTLVGHMEGLMQQVARVLSTAGTYARSGRIESTPPLPASLDLSH
jgi:hypothetical protein